MSHVQPCITNVLPDMPSCTYRDEHQLGCDGVGCKGCEPRAAWIGYTCAACYDRIQHALYVWPELESALHGIDRAVTRQASNHGKPGSQLPLAPIPIDFDAIRSYYASFTGTAERWVATAYLTDVDQYGEQHWRGSAADAVRFARAVEQAERAHPTHEKPHNLNRTRCPDCRQLAFVWHPPTFAGSPIKIECQNPNCNRCVTRPESIDTMAHIEATAPTEEQQNAAFLARLRRQKKTPAA